VKLALADADLRHAAPLVKPALLYADDVTIYSPTATIANAVRELVAVSDPINRLRVVLEIVRNVPQLREQIGGQDEALAGVEALLSLDPAIIEALVSTYGGAEQLESMQGSLDEMSRMWDEQMPGTVESSINAIGGEDVLSLLDSGLVTVADLASHTSGAVVGDAGASAMGDGGETSLVDDLLSGWMSHVLDMLNDPDSFPLLDGTSAGLIHALEREASVTASDIAVRRGSEVGAATAFMAFLPYFAQLPMDEILDLRRELQEPLVRFRGEMASLSRTFNTRQFDREFRAEVEDAWRQRVEPALADIREALSEHGLLREAASVARGDVRRLLVEAGGIFVAANTFRLSISNLMTAGIAVGAPLADVLGRALNDSRSGTAAARSNSFYFLHRLSEEAEQRARS
jgi:hypothetical protein